MSTIEKVKREVRKLSRLHKAALMLASLIAVLAVMAAFLQMYGLALGCLTALVVGTLCVVVYGNEDARRRLFGNTFDLPAPAETPSGGGDQAQLRGHDPTLLQWAKELRRGGRLQWFASLARETRLTGARDVLALSATSGAYDYRALVREIESLRFRSTDLQRRALLQQILWAPAYLSLARVLYSQRLDNRDLFNCLSLYSFAEDIFGMRVFSEGIDRSHYADLLSWNGEHTRAAEVLNYQDPDPDREYSQRYLRLNTVNPNLTGQRHQAGQWSAQLGEEFSRHGLVPPSFENPQAPSFYHIRCDAPAVTGGDLPRVSVIMPIYEPNAATDVAIESLLNQSWRNLEIIIIDDASPETDELGNPTPYRAQLEGWAARDSRIRLIFCEQNRGAYAVRNDAFDMATGEFVTIADKDDWHHPQRIERQARDLMKHHDKHANIVQWVRVDENVKFQVRWGPDRVIHPSFACIMFRRETVKDKLGYWDAVRKSADNEYKKRFELVFNTKLVSDDPVPMAFSLLGEDNLTSNDFGLGYRHPDREIYQRAYGAWHQSISAGASPFMPKNPDKRPFVAPPSFLPGRDKTYIPEYDVIFLSECGVLGGNTLGLVQEIEAALQRGLRVGLIALQNGLVPSAAKRRLVPELERLFLSGRIDWLTLDRQAKTPLMVVHWPTVMQLDTGTVSQIDVGRIVVVANQLPAAIHSDDRYYSMDQVSRNCVAAFGQQPMWAPQSTLARSYLLGQLPVQQLLPSNWASVVAHIGELRTEAHDPSALPVIGRPVSETESHWPPKTLRSQIYPTNGSCRVELRSNVQALRQHGVIGGDGVPPSWNVEAPGEESFLDYLGALDFLVCFDNQPWHESVEPSVLAALKAGVVVVLEPEYRSVYGEAAVYAEPKDVRRVLKALWEDPDGYADQQQRGVEFLRQNRSAELYLARLRESSAEGLPELEPAG